MLTPNLLEQIKLAMVQLFELRLRLPAAKHLRPSAPWLGPKSRESPATEHLKCLPKLEGFISQFKIIS